MFMGSFQRMRRFYPFRLTEWSHLDAKDAQAPAESLVFTDEQYWRSVGNLSGFASRVFLSALSDRCVFIGLSMTDLNIIRWLAINAIERGDDFRAMARGWYGGEMEHILWRDLSRHYWITEAPKAKETAFGTRVLHQTLERRGVNRIVIPSWSSKQFHTWWRSRFLPRAPTFAK